jgi:hypothetical protein
MISIIYKHRTQENSHSAVLLFHGCLWSGKKGRNVRELKQSETVNSDVTSRIRESGRIAVNLLQNVSIIIRITDVV